MPIHEKEPIPQLEEHSLLLKIALKATDKRLFFPNPSEIKVPGLSLFCIPQLWYGYRRTEDWDYDENGNKINIHVLWISPNGDIYDDNGNFIGHRW